MTERALLVLNLVALVLLSPLLVLVGLLMWVAALLSDRLGDES